MGGRDFYPRPPGGGRPEYFRPPDVLYHISIHALRVATKLSLRHGVPLLEFLSTPSGWRATLRAAPQRDIMA